MKIKLIKFRDDLIEPIRAHYNDAGMDCFSQEDVCLKHLSITMEEIYENVPIEVEQDPENENLCVITKYITEKIAEENPIPNSSPTLIPLGFGLEIPDGYMATIRPRSSMNAKGILTQIGTIDSGYRGEIKAVLINLTNEDIVIKKGERICQIVIEPVILAEFVDELKNDRRKGGFGSTGK